MHIEKPLASSEADARCIVAAAEEGGVHVCPGHSLLLIRRLRKPAGVSSGEIGEVVSVRAEHGFSYEGAGPICGDSLELHVRSGGSSIT